MKVIFLGDISLNDEYTKLHEEGLNPFSILNTYLSQGKFVIGNLECITKGENGENELKRPRLTTSVETLNYLNKINLSLACLAHNHVYDHLEDGFLKTIRFLDSHNIKYMGASSDFTKVDLPVVMEHSDIKIGILNFVTNDTNPDLPPESGIYLNIYNDEKAIRNISALKPCVDYVIVILHWGGRVEGGYYPDRYQPIIARKLIDNGADLIIGHHSHTFQPFEIYRGKHILYSLGNFCFSDYMFDGIYYPTPPRRRITAIVEVSFWKDYYDLNMSFFLNDVFSFHPLPDYINKVHHRNKIFKVLMRYKFLWTLYYIDVRCFLPLRQFLQRKDINFIEKGKRIWSSILKRIKQF